MNLSEYFSRALSQRHIISWEPFHQRKGDFQGLGTKSTSCVCGGDFNYWDGNTHPMTNNGGVWECMVPTAKVGDCYKFAITEPMGTLYKRQIRCASGRVSSEDYQ